MNYYEHHLGDYVKKAGHLTMLEHGAYRLLLDRYYIREKPFPGDVEKVQRLVGARTEEEKAAVEAVLEEFFELVDDEWRHARCDLEIEKAQQRIEAARKNGKRGGRPKANPEETQPKPNKNPPGLCRVSSGNPSLTQQKALQSPDTRHQLLDADDARVNLVELERKLFEAGGKCLDPTSTGLMVLDRPLAWLQAGCDLERDILPTIRAVAARTTTTLIRSWKFFEQAVSDAYATRTAPMIEGRAANDPASHRQTQRAKFSSAVAGVLGSGDD